MFDGEGVEMVWDGMVCMEGLIRAMILFFEFWFFLISWFCCLCLLVQVSSLNCCNCVSSFFDCELAMYVAHLDICVVRFCWSNLPSFKLSSCFGASGKRKITRRSADFKGFSLCVFCIVTQLISSMWFMIAARVSAL
jgi:hypothetical protein